MVEQLLLRLARAVDAHHRPIAIVCLAVALAGVVVVVRMPIKTDILDVLPEGNPSIAAFTDFLRDFAALDGMVIVVESKEPSPDLLIGLVESIGVRLAASPLAASVDYNLLRSGSRLMAQHFPLYLDPEGVAALSERLSREGIRRQIRRDRESLLSLLSSPFEADLIARDPLNLRGIVRDSLLRRSEARGLDLATGYYMDLSHTLAFLILRPNGQARDMAFVGRLQREIADIVAEAMRENGSPRGVVTGLAGGYARAAEAASVIWRDMVVSFVSSFVLVLLLIYVSLRPGLRVLLVFILTLLSSLSWTLLLAYFLFGALNIVTSIVAAMLIGLFVDYLIHIYKRFEEEFRRGGNPLQAMEKTLSGTGKAILTGSLTTSAAFFSIVVTSFRGLHELGVVAGFGVFFCLLGTLLIMTSLLSWLAHASPASLPAGRPGGIGTGFLARIVERHSGAVVVVSAALIVVGSASAFHVRFDTDPESLGLSESAVRAVDRKIEERLGRRGEPLALVARAADEEQLTADFDLMARKGRSWRGRGIAEGFSSPALLLPGPSDQAETRKTMAKAGLAGRFSEASLAKMVKEEMARQGLVPDPSTGDYAKGVARALALRETVGLPELARSGDPRAAYFYNPARHAIAAHLSPPGGRWERSTLAALREEVRGMGPDFRLIGASLIFEEIRSTILREVGAAILLSFAANVLIVRLHFRRWKKVWLAMLPVTAGTLLTVGTMGALSLPFNFFNVAAIGLIFGMGVDYGIYIMQTRDEEDGNGPAAVRRTGGNVILCTVTTIASCGSLATSHYKGIASIGSVLSLGVLYCLFASLLLVPSLIPRRGENPGGHP
jgi:predicted RND superfamily exporter protein